MPRFLYDSYGNPVGYINGDFIHTLGGTPVGQVVDTHVHKLSGEYVGELYKDMVVNMNLGDLGNIGHAGNPGNPGYFGIPENRGAIETKYTDVFDDLLDRIDINREIKPFQRHLF